MKVLLAILWVTVLDTWYIFLLRVGVNVAQKWVYSLWVNTINAPKYTVNSSCNTSHIVAWCTLVCFVYIPKLVTRFTIYIISQEDVVESSFHRLNVLKDAVIPIWQERLDVLHTSCTPLISGIFIPLHLLDSIWYTISSDSSPEQSTSW